MTKTFHHPNSTDINELRRVFLLVQQDAHARVSDLASTISKQVQTIAVSPGTTGTMGPTWPVGPPGPSGVGAASILTGFDVSPGLLFDQGGDVVTDVLGNVLVGFDVVSSLLIDKDGNVLEPQ